MVKVWILESKKPFDPVMIEGVFLSEDNAWDRKRKLQERDDDMKCVVHGPFHVE